MKEPEVKVTTLQSDKWKKKVRHAMHYSNVIYMEMKY